MCLKPCRQLDLITVPICDHLPDASPEACSSGGSIWLFTWASSLLWSISLEERAHIRLSPLNSERSSHPRVRKSPQLISKVMGPELIENCSTRETANWSWSWMQLTWKSLSLHDPLRTLPSGQSELVKGKTLCLYWGPTMCHHCLKNLSLVLLHLMRSKTLFNGFYFSVFRDKQKPRDAKNWLNTTHLESGRVKICKGSLDLPNFPLVKFLQQRMQTQISRRAWHVTQ